MTCGKTLLAWTVCCVLTALPCTGFWNTKEAKVFDVLCEIVTGYEEYTINGQLDLDDCANVPTSQVSLTTAIYSRYEAIRNSYRIVALSYMAVSRYLLDNADNEELLAKAVECIARFQEYALKMVLILYSIGLKDVYDVSSFYTYVSEIRSYLVWYGAQGGNTAARLIEVHDKVTGSLRENVKATNNGNRFDLTHSTRCRLYRDFKILECVTDSRRSSELALSLISDYDKVVGESIAAYKGKYDLGPSTKVESFELDNCLYLNNVAFDVAALDRLLDAYDGNVVWGGAKEGLRKAYDLAKGNPDKLLDGFRIVEHFQQMFYDLVKIVVLRITWTQVNLAKAVTGQFIIIKRQKILTNWTKVLSKFTKVPGFEKDEFFAQLISVLKNPSDQDTYIKTKIHELSKNFNNFDALTDPVDASALTDMVKNLTTYATKINALKTRPKLTKAEDQPVNQNINRAVIFVSHLTKLLENVNFATTKAIFKSSSRMEDTQNQPE